MSRRTLRLACAALAVVAGSTNAGPPIEQWQTANGARVLFVAAPEIPMVDVRVVFAAGSARDQDRAGLAHLTAELLREGAGDRDADAFNQALSRTGAQLGAAAARDMAYLNLRTLIEETYATPALALLRDALAAPRFDDEAVERAKARTLLALRQKAQSPAAVAEDAFYAELYPNHPYGTPTLGTAASVAALTRADVVDFHARYYVARNAVIAIVGALDRAAAAAVAEAGCRPARGRPGAARPPRRAARPARHASSSLDPESCPGRSARHDA